MSNTLANSTPPTPGSPSADAPRILLLEDSPGEAELFCQAVALAWETFEPEAKSLRPCVDVQYTAQDALDGVKRQVGLEGRNLPDLVLDLELPGGVPPAMVLIYVVMVGLFRSWLAPFVVMFTIPLRFIGLL